MLCSKATGRVKGIANVSAIGGPVGVKIGAGTTVIGQREQVSTRNGRKLRDGTIAICLSPQMRANKITHVVIGYFHANVCTKSANNPKTPPVSWNIVIYIRVHCALINTLNFVQVVYNLLGWNRVKAQNTLNFLQHIRDIQYTLCIHKLQSVMAISHLIVG